MLLSGRSELLWSHPESGDLLVRARPGSLASAVGNPPVEPLVQAAEADASLKFVLCPPELAGTLEAALPRWKRSRVVIFSLPGGLTTRSAEPAPIVTMLSRDDASRLPHLPAVLREEIIAALEGSHAAATFLEGVPVAFCYAAWETETLWDVSIDTLEPYRRRGLARACVEFLVDHMSGHGKFPVWGTSADNRASLALARSLGFVEVDRLALFERGPEER